MGVKRGQGGGGGRLGGGARDMDPASIRYSHVVHPKHMLIPSMLKQNLPQGGRASLCGHPDTIVHKHPTLYALYPAGVGSCQSETDET